MEQIFTVGTPCLSNEKTPKKTGGLGKSFLLDTARHISRHPKLYIDLICGVKKIYVTSVR